MTATIAAGCGSDEPVETVDLNSMTLEEIEAQAKEEGELASAAMPDTWANWGETWQEYTDTYGIRQATGILFRTGQKMTTETGSSVITGQCQLSSTTRL